MKYGSKSVVVVAAVFVGTTGTAFATPTPITQNRDIHIAMSNDAGALYGSGPDDSYWLNAPGGGLNQLHISTDSSPGAAFGQVTSRNIATSSATGTFYVTTTGGRGYNDNIILGFSIQGPIADDFSLKVKSSGYQWTASTAGVVNPVYVTGAVNETFGGNDFLYGPNTAKPGPGSGFVLPFYSGQDINDPATAQYLMFIDLNVGNVSAGTTTPGNIDGNSAKVEFEVSGIYENIVSFNAYAWAFSANIADASINWTNRLSTNPADPGQSGYSIETTAVAQAPEPGTGLLLGLGLAGFGAVQRRRRAA